MSTPAKNNDKLSSKAIWAGVRGVFFVWLVYWVAGGSFSRSYGLAAAFVCSTIAFLVCLVFVEYFERYGKRAPEPTKQ